MMDHPAAGSKVVVGTSDCIKCKAKPSTINVRFATYCNDCFLEQAYHKYRISVAKCKKSSLPERIMVAYSGGNASHLLLHFTQLARLTDPQRKNLDKFIIVCISFGYSEEQKAAITKAVSAYGLFCEFISLSKALYGEDDKDGDQKLEGLFKSCKMETTKVDLLCIIKRVALILTAMQRDCSKIYLGETCSSIAVKVLADTCTGRGISIPWMLSPSQRYFGLVDDMEVTTIRPLRELVNLEVDYYLSLTEKDFTAAPIKSTIMTEPSQSNSSPNSNPNPNPKSILELTKDFISSLDAENSATVSTVTRTTCKIRTAISDLQTWQPCSLCICPLLPDQAADGRPFCYGCHSLLEEMDPSWDLQVLPTYTRTLMIKTNNNRV